MSTNAVNKKGRQIVDSVEDTLVLPQVKGNKNIVRVADAMTENYLKKHMKKIV